MTPAEKDAFVAANLFGQELSYEKCGECFGTGYILDPDPDPDEGACCGQIKCPRCGGKPYYLLGYPKPTRDYSTDVKAAWEAVEKLGELGYTVHIEWKGSDRVYAETAEAAITKSIYTVGHGVGNFPEAVCNATIMALSKPNISNTTKICNCEGVCEDISDLIPLLRQRLESFHNDMSQTCQHDKDKELEELDCANHQAYVQLQPRICRSIL